MRSSLRSGTLATCSLVSLLIGPALATTFNVSPGQSIQAAINGASAGDTIQVGPGSYTEALLITKDGITLQGNQAVLSPGATAGPCDNLNIDGLNYTVGICVQGQNVQFTDPNSPGLSYFEVASVDRFVAGVTVTGFQVQQFGVGVYTLGASGANIVANSFYGTNYNSVQSIGCQGTQISNNVATCTADPDNGELGGYYTNDFTGANITFNTVNDCRIGILVDSPASTVECNFLNNLCSAIGLVEASVGSTVAQNIITGTNSYCPGRPRPPVAIDVIGGDNSTIECNTIFNISGPGIQFNESYTPGFSPLLAQGNIVELNKLFNTTGIVNIGAGVQDIMYNQVS